MQFSWMGDLSSTLQYAGHSKLDIKTGIKTGTRHPALLTRTRLLNVRRLQIALRRALLVRPVDRLGDLPGVPGRPVRRTGILADQPGQVLPVDIPFPATSLSFGKRERPGKYPAKTR